MELSEDHHHFQLLTSLCHLITEALQAFLDLELQTNYDLDDGMLLLGLATISIVLTCHVI